MTSQNTINHQNLETEDLIRMIGELNASVNHIVSSLSATDDPDLRAKLDFAYRHLVTERRRYSVMLKNALDLDDKLYCIVTKHLPTAITLAGEIGQSAEIIYVILSMLTNGKIEPCSSCSKDMSEGEGEIIEVKSKFHDVSEDV